MTTEASPVQDKASPEQTPGVSRREQSQLLVKNYTMGSLAPAVFPFPLIDLAALLGIQLKMLNDLCAIYQVEFSEKLGRASIISLVSSVLPVAASPLLASLVKFIPGVGQLSGVASMLLLAGASTHALGMVFIRHFEQGGSLDDFDANTMKGYFMEEFEKGKQVATELKEKVSHKKVGEETSTPSAETAAG